MAKDLVAGQESPCALAERTVNKHSKMQLQIELEIAWDDFTERLYYAYCNVFPLKRFPGGML
jgi:hypothetical protein